MTILTCVFTIDYPYDRLRRRNKERDNQRLIAAFRKEYDKETDLRIQRDNELVRRQVILECHNQQKVQLDEIRKKQNEELEFLQSQLYQKKIELEICRNNYKQDYQYFQNTHKESEDKIARLTQDIEEKGKNIEELETRISEMQISYNRQIEELKIRQQEEMEQFKQKTINELRDEDYESFRKVIQSLETERERLMREFSERVKIVTTYAVMELAKFGFSPESYAFIKSKVCTFAETGGKFDKTEPSPIANPFKDVNARKRGRKKKVNTGENVLGTLEIAHYARNIAIYLDFRIEDAARLVEYMFKDWYEDGDFMTITKAAAKSPDSGLIRIHEDLEAYVREQGWME